MTRLGLGLIGIGRPWPSAATPIPTATGVQELLTEAHRLGVTVFDTAPAYGASEKRLGGFLEGLGTDARRLLTICTKVGEQWSPERGSHTDHSVRATVSSVRRSFEILQGIDVLTVHKASSQVLCNPDFVETLLSLKDEYGIAHLGASVSDIESAKTAAASGWLSWVQLPVNEATPSLAKWAAEHDNHLTVVGNRPFGSGRLIESRESVQDLLSFAVRTLPHGVVLTGTTNTQHLRQTIQTFNKIRTN